jgi:hypothetical protein
MVANTTRGITYPTGTDDVAPLQTVFATMATSIDTALGKLTFRPADLAALAALVGMSPGDIATVLEGGAIFRYTGTSWVQATPASFSSSAARDTAYAKASGTYRVGTARVFRTDTNYEEMFVNGGWAPTRINTTGVSRNMGTLNSFNNATTYSVFPIPADATAMTASFTKIGANTRIRARVYGTAELGSGVAQMAYIGLRFNSTDYDVARRAFPQAVSRESFVNEVFLTGITAGTYTIQPVFKAAGASAFNFYTDDTVSWVIDEVI